MQAASLAACLVLPALLALGQTRADKHSTGSVGVFMDFDSKPGNASLEVMEREVEGLLKASGVTLDWRQVKQNDGTEAFSGLVMLKFRGRCRVEPVQALRGSDSPSGGMHTLGSTLVENGRVLPFSQVECDQVRKALAYLHPGAGWLERQRALGRALGRVVAHELYHMLAGATEHASTGLARASQSLRDLISAHEIVFGEEDSRAIRNGFH